MPRKRVYNEDFQPLGWLPWQPCFSEWSVAERRDAGVPRLPE